MKITWIGHSCFKVNCNNYSLVFDPYEDGSVPGIGPVREQANQVLCSHEHHDHNARQTVEIVDACAGGAACPVGPSDACAGGAACPVIITEINTFHDPDKGAKRGENIIRIISDGKTRIAHLGDLGCELEPAQKELLKGLDVVMIPVGGFFTIDAKEAAKLVKEIAPKVVIPMHYHDANKGFGFDVIGSVDAFVDAGKECGITNVVKEDGCYFEISVDSDFIKKSSAETTVVILTPQNTL